MKNLAKTTTLFIILIFGFISCSNEADNISVVLINDFSEAGSCVFVWDQSLENGDPAPVGTYTVKMDSGDFNSNLNFDISSTSGHKKSPNETSSCNTGSLPTQYELGVLSTSYAPGDSVNITYDLPQASNVKITVTRN